VPSIISPDELEADAVVPQCLDNQYVSDRIFQHMANNGVDYEDPGVARQREADFKNEFIRSLVYSSQVVVQRAFLKNSEFLYRNYLPGNPVNRAAFATLLREGAVVPCLFKEDSLLDSLIFDLREDGDRALRDMLAEVPHDIPCVRLAVDPNENRRRTASMETNFGVQLTRPEFMSDEQRNAMAVELFAEPEVLQQPGEWDRFGAALDQFMQRLHASTSRLRADGRTLRRQDIYRENFAADGRDDNVVLGRFASDAHHPFLLELKKYVDLIYNTNLPDHLGRYTFTPAHMPSRMAVQDYAGKGYSHEQLAEVLTDADALEYIRQSFMARAQAAMGLPLLRELSVADVTAIRKLPEWTEFTDAQVRILRDPLHCLDLLEPFQQRFDRFQTALGAWYNEHYERRRTIERYCTFISVALSVGGRLVVAGSHTNPFVAEAIGYAADQLIERIPRRVKGYAAKLLVGVYDIGAHRLDNDRTYTIDLMRTSEELMREDVVDLLRTVTGQSDDEQLPVSAWQVADQGGQ
jgi:hypothetical protein